MAQAIMDASSTHCRKGICPYRDGWPSGHTAEVLWPLVEVRIFVGGALHHNRCKCWGCKPEAQRLVERMKFHRGNTFAGEGEQSIDESEEEAVPSPILLANYIGESSEEELVRNYNGESSK